MSNEIPLYYILNLPGQTSMIYKRAQHSSFRMNIYKATDNIGPGHKAGTRQVPLSKKMKATVQESISNTRVT